MNEVCVVELGRYGDIVNILPILQHIHNQYGKPALMVSREFADMLDGVSYVTPCVVDLRNDQLADALKLAHKQFKHVICAQIWGGPNYIQDRLCESFNVESWRKCGFLHKFKDPTWRPLFDLRDFEREADLVKKVKTNKPMLLVNLTHSVSSPFASGAGMLEYIHAKLACYYNIVNVGGLKLHRIYDLLGLMDEAVCLVSVDSAHLHLAAATTIPVVALVNNDAWLATTPRASVWHRMSYASAVKDPLALFSLIQKLAVSIRPEHAAFGLVGQAKIDRKLFHCVEIHSDRNPAEIRRKDTTQKSWDALYSQGVIACHLNEADYPRTAESIGDFRKLPFLKDVLKLALQMAGNDDIIFFSNDDNFLHRELPELLKYHIALYECACSQRCEFVTSGYPAPTKSPGEFTHGCRSHMGRDLFAFTKRWLVSHWNEIPDFILGASDWDLCLAAIIRNHFGIQSTRKNYEEHIHPAELPLGYVSHRFHRPLWAAPMNVNTAPSQLHNRTAFRDWSLAHAPHLQFDKRLCI